MQTIKLINPLTHPKCVAVIKKVVYRLLDEEEEEEVQPHKPQIEDIGRPPHLLMVGCENLEKIEI